jgi:hypothetical protein
MANLIQIRRSNTAASPLTTLYGGELGYSYYSNTIYVGAQTGVGTTAIKIGGEKYGWLDRTSSGALTANAALITDANSFVSNVYTQGLAVQTSSLSLPVYITSISNTSNSTNLGANVTGGGIGTELVTTAALVTYIAGRTSASPGGISGNGQFLFNNSGIVTGANNMAYDYTSGAITIGNNTVNVQLGYFASNNQLAHFHGSANTYIQVQIQNANTGPNASADLVINADNATDSINYVDLGINSSLWSNSGWTINGADDGYLYAANGSMAVGTASAKPIQFFVGGTLAVNEAVRIDSGANVGIGNTTPNAKLQVTGTANISGAVAIGGITTLSQNLVIATTGSIVANGSIGTNGQVLVSNGTTIYWGTGIAGANTQVQYNDSGVANATAGFTFTKTSNTLFVGNTITVGANSTLNTNYLTFAGNTTTAPTITVGVANLTFTGIVMGNSTITGTPTFNIANSAANTTVTAANITTSWNFTANSLGVYHTGVVNAATISTGTTFTANSTLVNAAAINVTGQVNVATLYATTSANVGTYFTANSTVVNAIAITTANVTTTTNVMTIGTTLYINTTGNVCISNSAPTDKLSVNGTTTLGGNVVILGGNIVATSANLNVKDVNVSGNLTVAGTLTTIDTVNLQVKDNMIKLADQNSATDTLDFGIYGVYGNSTVTQYAGLYRQNGVNSGTAALSSPVFKLFASNTEPSTIVDSTALGYGVATLQAYLQPYGAAGALIANSTVVNITANGTVSSAIVANSMTLTTALAASYGGTGQSSYTTGDILYASGSTALSKLSVPGSSANGQVLQIVNNLPAYNTLDGGTF